MKFDTFLKLTQHAAKIVQHDSFHEMSRMIHRGVKRRIGAPPPPQRLGQTPPKPNQPKTFKDYLTAENYNTVRQVVKGLANLSKKQKP